MCGLAGYFDLRDERPVEPEVLTRMTAKLRHRGPDSVGFHREGALGLGFHRLRIIGLDSGDQPLYNEERSVVLVCNGEIFNYRELKAELVAAGHRFATATDVEVLVHLYEEEGIALLDRLNGQFAFALWDSRNRRLFLARDHFGINPLYWTVQDDELVFGSEVKAILEHPRVERRVDLTGLDHVLSFPGLVPPRTLFDGIHSLEPGHHLRVEDGRLEKVQYWDLDYPLAADGGDGRPEDEYVDELAELLARAVDYRMQADVPVGLYLSGGMDSSMIAALAHRLRPREAQWTFSITFSDPSIDERRFQQAVVRRLGTEHREVRFDERAFSDRLALMIYHGERPVKESFNACALALAKMAADEGMKVILAGQGADELFGGYPGYRFDQRQCPTRGGEVEAAFEEELREELWGDPDLFYEKDQHAFREVKHALYSDRLREAFQGFDGVRGGVVDKARLKNRADVHKRSYLDVKLRLADHLLTEHGDHMVMAHSVEGRYPFLDLDLVRFVRSLPPRLKVNDLTEKYILRKVAGPLIPREVVSREKFGFRGPGSPYLLQRGVEWVEDLLSQEQIRRQGYFDPDLVEMLKSRYSTPGFSLHGHLETDLLMFVLTFNLLLETFALPEAA